MFGTPGPDSGYALKILDDIWSRLLVGAGDERHDLEAALVATALRRTSLEGRAPIAEDLEWAAVYWGILSDLGPPGAASPSGLSAEARGHLFGGCSHDFELQREIASRPADDLLALSPDGLAAGGGRGGVDGPHRDPDRVDPSPGVTVIAADD